MIIEHVEKFVADKIKKWHPVIDFWMEPCEAPMSVYIHTAGPAAIKATLHLLAFGWDDVARGALRPRDVYPRTHLRGKGGRRINRGVPELGEEIGKRLPGAQTMKGGVTRAGEKLLWVADGVEQRAMFWVMLADIATDLAYDHMTGIIKTGYCSQPGPWKMLVGWEHHDQFFDFHHGNNYALWQKIHYLNGWTQGTFGGYDAPFPGDYRYHFQFELNGPHPQFEIEYGWLYPPRNFSRFVPLDDLQTDHTTFVSLQGVARCGPKPGGYTPGIWFRFPDNNAPNAISHRLLWAQIAPIFKRSAIKP